MITGRQSSRDTILSAVFDDFFPDLASTASFWTCDRLLHFYKWTSTWMSFRKANPWNKWVCSHFEKNRSVQSSTWAHPLLLSFAQGKGHNPCSTAPIRLAADKTPFWQGPTAQYGGSLTQWSRENSRADALNSWYIFRGVGREGEKGRVRNRRNPADQRFLPLFIHCPQQRTPRDFPDDLLFILTYKC